MRFNVTFNQLELMAYNERQPKEKKIDIKDAIILQQLWHLSKWKEVDKIDLKTGQYFWAAYGKILNELPAMGFANNDSLSKRIREKLIKNGFLKLHVNWKDNSKTYWQFTEAGLKIAERGKDLNSRSNDGTRGGRMTEREGVAPLNERGSHGGTDNYNTNDSFTKDEREARALDFLKENYDFSFKQFEKEHKPKINNWEKFCLDFNDVVDEKELKYDGKVLIAKLKRYARNWIDRQPDEKENLNKHPSQRKIILEKPKNFL
jgi:hypothetical protein